MMIEYCGQLYAHKFNLGKIDKFVKDTNSQTSFRMKWIMWIVLYLLKKQNCSLKIFHKLNPVPNGYTIAEQIGEFS